MNTEIKKNRNGSKIWQRFFFLPACILSLLLLLFAFVQMSIFFYELRRFHFTLLEHEQQMQMCYQKKCSAVYQPTLQYHEIPQIVRDYLVYQEDQRFFQHAGISFREIFVSLRDAIFYGQRLRGASTITQQLARSLFLVQDRTLTRKLSEWQLAFALESQFAKEKILEMYVNTSYWGHSQIGLRSAANFYFGIPVSQLSSRQVSFLVSLLPRPESCLHWQHCADTRIHMRMERILKKFLKKGIEKSNQ